ncbi:MAG: DUF3892 domain-containing protein [Clostridia bacterium]|nr:DUF3892 domain-containing protein [Clostridia bacterium]
MEKPKLIVTKESATKRNIEFQDTRNNRKMTDKELISRLKTGNSSYNEDYCVKTDKNGKEYVSSKPDGKEKNNLG